MSTKSWRDAASFPPVRVSFYFDPDSSGDRAFCEMLDRQLAPLKRNGWIDTWNDWQIPPGGDKEQEREHHLKTDHLLILLISPDFLASEACRHQTDMALQRHTREDARVIPILIRPCLWEQTDLKTLQMLPREQQAPGVQPSPEALQTIATELNQIIHTIQQRAFIAYAPEDRDFVERLHRDLALSSVRLWSPDRAQLTSDPGQSPQVQGAMRDASVVLLIASTASIDSSAVKAQMALASDYHHPVVIVWVSGAEQELRNLEKWQADAVIDARAERYEKACEELVAQVKQQARIISASQSSQGFSVLQEPRNPYKGLQPFTARDVRDFFGREAQVGKLISGLEQILAPKRKGEFTSRLLTVLGGSGAGKSSIVMAGLLPRLQQGDIPGSQAWIYLDDMLPTAHPLEALAISLSRQPSLGSAPSLRHALNSDSLRTLHLLASQLSRTSSQKVVLFIDQFEEVFAPAVSEEERQRFFDLLIPAVTTPQGPLLVLLTLRADFYDRPMQYPDLYEVLTAHSVTVLPMQREDLRRVIEGPAQLPDVQITFEEGLVGDLLFDVRELGAPLPLLQFTLAQLFTLEQHLSWREGRRLTRQAYVASGGVKGALIKRADETYAALPSKEHQELAEILFTRLIEPGIGLQDTTRRRVPRKEFDVADSRLTQLLQETMDAFIAARLLTVNRFVDTTTAASDAAGEGLASTEAGIDTAEKKVGPTTIEISHEALIREWPLYGRWIKNARENLPVQQTLSKDVEQWEKLGEPRDRLYRSSQLKSLQAKINPRVLSKQQVRFLRASTARIRLELLRIVALLLVPVILLGLILTPVLVYKPVWCPTWLCPAPQVLLARGGANDSNLQVTFQTLQSSFHILTNAPSSYNLGNLPTANDAELLSTNQTFPYRVVLKIHSLQSGTFGLVIEQVILVIAGQVQAVPYPLRVYRVNNVLPYNNNLYQVTYRGQATNALLPAFYVVQPLGHASLLPGETDEISLEVRSAVVTDLHFQVQVTYQILGQSTLHMLKLPKIFEVVFSDLANWHPYQLQNGQLVTAV